MRSMVLTASILVAFALAAGDDAIVRVPVPAADKIAETEKLIKEVFAEQYALTKPAEKLELAQKLAQQGEETKDDPAARYVLMREATTLAAQGGDVAQALTNLEKLDTQFELPADAKKAILTPIGAATKDAELTKAIAAMKTLCDTPADPAANVVYARYACLSLNNWPKGLAALEKGSHAALKALATKDLAAGDDTALALGDEWWDLYEKETAKDLKPLCGERARHWYAKVLPTLTGLSKTKLEKRLAALPPPPSKESSVAAAQPAATPAAAQKPAPGGAPRGGKMTQPVAVVGELKSAVLDGTKNVTEGAYRLAGSWIVHEKAGETDIVLDAGVEIRGGLITLGGKGRVHCNGTYEKPVILRGVTIGGDNGSYLKATYTIFDKCKLWKSGSWYSYHSTKWECSNSILYKTFIGMAAVDYGFKYTDCVFADMTLPEIKHRFTDGFDHMMQLKREWNTLKNATFINCVIPPTVVWCAGEANYYRCKYVTGEAFVSGKDTEIEIYCQQPDKFPHEAWINAKPKDKPVKMKYRKEPFPFVELPSICPVPEMNFYAPLIYPKQ